MIVHVAIFQASALGNAKYGMLREQGMARDLRVRLSSNLVGQPDHGLLGWVISSVCRARHLDFGHFCRAFVTLALGYGRRGAGLPVIMENTRAESGIDGNTNDGGLVKAGDVGESVSELTHDPAQVHRAARFAPIAEKRIDATDNTRAVPTSAIVVSR